MLSISDPVLVAHTIPLFAHPVVQVLVADNDHLPSLNVPERTDRRGQWSSAAHRQTRHLPCQSQRKRFRPEKEQMVRFLNALLPRPPPATRLFYRLPKIKAWIDTNNPGDPLIPFSVALEDRLSALSPEDKRQAEQDAAPSALGKITQAGYSSLDVSLDCPSAYGPRTHESPSRS